MVSEKKYQQIGYLLIFLHVVGAVGSMISTTRPMMILLTPFNLLLSSALLIFAHKGSYLKLFLLLFATSAIGFFVEVIGVETGIIFGSYQYGSTLGFELLNVPVIIGLNWFLMTYLFGNLVNPLKINATVKIFTAAAMMTAMDILMEPVAVSLDYWHWNNNVIPIQNFIGWFVLSILMQTIYAGTKSMHQNPLTRSLLISQLIFFISLLFYVL